MTQTLHPEPRGRARPATYDYPWVRAWGQLLNWPPSILYRHLKKARAEHAPAIAVCPQYIHAGWMTLDGIINPETRLWFIAWAEANDLAIPKEVMSHWIDPGYDPDRVPGINLD